MSNKQKQYQMPESEERGRFRVYYEPKLKADGGSDLQFFSLF